MPVACRPECHAPMGHGTSSDEHRPGTANKPLTGRICSAGATFAPGASPALLGRRLLGEDRPDQGHRFLAVPLGRP